MTPLLARVTVAGRYDRTARDGRVVTFHERYLLTCSGSGSQTKVRGHLRQDARAARLCEALMGYVAGPVKQARQVCFCPVQAEYVKIRGVVRGRRVAFTLTPCAACNTRPPADRQIMTLVGVPAV
jgi:hypothetical protein